MKKGILKVFAVTMMFALVVAAKAFFGTESVRAAEYQNLLVNGGGEEGMLGWTDTADREKYKNGLWEPSLSTTNHKPMEGETFFWPSKRGCEYALMYQDVDISSFPAGSWMRLSAWLANYNQSPHDQATLKLEFLNSNGEVLDSKASQQRNPEWGFHEIFLSIPKNAVTARVSCIANRFVGSDNDAYFDDISLVVTEETFRAVKVTGDKDKANVGETIQLYATDGVYSDASDYEWSSSYDENATVDENGLVTIVEDDTEVWIYAKNKHTDVTGSYYINSELENTDPDIDIEDDPEPEIDDNGDESSDLADAKITLMNDTYSYTGQEIIPYCVVEYEDSVLEENVDYTVVCENNTAPGIANIKFVGIGEFTGEAVASFKITPATVYLKSVTSSGSKWTLSWNKFDGADGYQVYYSKSETKSFKKLYSGKNLSASSKKIKSGMYIRIRTYKKTDDGTLYSDWSKPVKVK